MKKSLVITAATLVLAVAAAGLSVLSARLPHPFEDPESARCNAPEVQYGAVRVLPNHRELDVHFRCAGAVLAGTLNLPTRQGAHPAVVWVHGAGENARLGFKGTPLIQTLVRSGVAVFSYDKRGVGESHGECCPGDYGQFNLLAADAVGAVSAIRARAEIDDDRIGLLGANQAGWIVPLAAERSRGRVAFTALVDAPVVSFGDGNSGQPADR